MGQQAVPRAVGGPVPERCYDLGGNLTSQGTDPGCPRGTTYTYNDAQEVTGKSGSTGTWSYDQIGNETAADSTSDYTRTAETWTDHSQMSSITINGKAYAGQYGSTDQASASSSATPSSTTAPSACPRRRPPEPT